MYAVRRNSRVTQFIGALILAAGLAAAPAAKDRKRSASAPSDSKTIDDFFRNFTDEWVRANPNLATSSRYFSGEEQDKLERQLTPETAAYRQERIRLALRGLADLAKFDRGQMNETQRVSADLMHWQLDMYAREEPYLDYSFPLEQFNGANVRLPNQLTVVHPLRTGRDGENYLAALGQVGLRMQEATAEARRLIAKHMTPPKFILQATMKQMQEFSDVPPAQNPLVTAFTQRLGAANSVSAEKLEAMRAEAEKILAEQVYPAWKDGIATLKPLVDHATDDAGLWRFKGGSDAYAFYLARYTTTKLTPTEIHQIGLKQVTEIEAQMDALLRRLGRTEGSVKERIAKLQADLEYPNPTSEESRAAIMRNIDGILADALKRSALLFDKTPKSAVIAQPYPRFREANAAASYTPAPLDGSRPGTFQFPLRPERMTKFGLRSLVYHETVPGHHFQIALELENQSLPRFRQVRALGGISALGEGWALYAERLAAESGWYESDPEGQLGELNDQLFRARRLVVDTGLHAQHWTRQQAIDYGIEPSEVERYVMYPGQACSYMIGELKIVELREKTRKALGDHFSLQRFHDVVLNTGTVPLDLLEQQVDAYIRASGGRP
jgi:uncharacterized protein (DUF885 family)